jgi:hypothetical protein
MKSLFVCRFALEVSTTDTEKSLSDQLELSSLTCSRFKKISKFTLPFTFQLQENLRSIKNTEVSTNGYLIASFYVQVISDQMYSLEVSDIPVAVAPASSRDTEKICMNPKGGDGVYGSSCSCSM